MKKLILFICLWNGLQLNVKGQDIYDYKHSYLYLQQLIQTGERSLALQEFESITQRFALSDSLLHLILEDDWYIKNLSYKEAKTIINHSFYTQQTHPQQAKLAAIQGIPLNNHFVQNCLNIKSGNYPEDIQRYGTLYEYVKWKEHYRKKNQFVAGTMALIPGLGKVYLGKPLDGLFSFLLIGSYSFFSYRGFSQQGLKSVPGYGFGILATGFYAGSISGTLKLYKERKKNHIKEDQKRYEEAIINYNGPLLR